MENIPHCRNSSKIRWKNRRNRGKLYTYNTHVHGPSLYWPGTYTYIIKPAGTNYLYGPNPPPPPLTEMM